MIVNPKTEAEFCLTDGGLETTLIFHYGVELPHFAAFTLLDNDEGKEHLRKYYSSYLALAQKHDLRFILDTPTWRASADWGAKLGYSSHNLDEINQQAVRFIRELRAQTTRASQVLIGGVIGPRGDGYIVAERMTVEQSKQYHLPQLQAFATEGVDIATALTITYSNEAIGIVAAAQELEVDVAISFTVETNGHLPSGETLAEAIQRTDEQTNAYATYFMINCAHPQHFRTILKDEGKWQQRIRGIRANASTKSHAELDESETLDTGDRNGLAKEYTQLKELLPNLRIIGGCCGTDHNHLQAICNQLLS